jgi:hypothetical protein
MGLIGEHCSQCAAAANAEDGGGIAGAWWRGWANVYLRNASFHLMDIDHISRRENTPVTLALVSLVQSCLSLQYGI